MLNWLHLLWLLHGLHLLLHRLHLLLNRLHLLLDRLHLLLDRLHLRLLHRLHLWLLHGLHLLLNRLHHGLILHHRLLLNHRLLVVLLASHGILLRLLVRFLTLDHDRGTILLFSVTTFFHAAAYSHDNGHETKSSEDKPQPSKITVVTSCAGIVSTVIIVGRNRVVRCLGAHPGLRAASPSCQAITLV